MTDLLIKNGQVVDGTGSPSRRADVRIRGDRIVEVGSSLPLGNAQLLDVEGAFVTPGFIDCHTHFDASLFWDPRCDPMPEHGVTTVLIGNCSLGLAPVTPSSKNEIADVFSYIEDIPRDLFSSIVPWNWQSYPEYAQSLGTQRFAVNVIGLVPHSWLRTYVMGPAAWTRPATKEEAVAIARELRAAIQAGASGLSTSLFDKDSQGRPVPSAMADDDELDLIFKTLGATGTFAQLIPRHPDTAAIDEDLRRFGVFSGRHAVPVLVNAITDPIFDPTAAQKMLDCVHALKGLDAEIYPMLSPRSVEVVLNFHTTMSLSRIPAWNQLVVAPVEEKRRFIVDPEWRARARVDWDSSASQLCPSKRLETLRIISVGDAPNLKEWIGRNFSEMVSQRGGHPSDVLADWLGETNLDARFVYPLTNQRPDVVGKLLREPAVIIGASDAGAHFQAFCGAGDSTLLLTRHVRDRSDLTLEAAIHGLTERQAKLMGLRDRGVIRPGAIADLTIFDLNELTWLPDTLVNDVPGGVGRLRRPPGGYRYTILAGEIVQANGKPVDRLPGRFLGSAS